MSEFYKEIRKESRDLGITTIFQLPLIVILSVIIIDFFIKVKDPFGSDAYLLIYFIPGTIISAVLKWINAKKSNEKNKIIQKIKINPKINMSTVNFLIEEIETSMKNTKTFITWFLGVLVTLIVLIIPLTVELGSQVFGVYLQTFNDVEIRYVVESFLDTIEASNDQTLIGILFNFGSQLLLILICSVLLIYVVFYLMTFSKKIVLTLLHDVRYELEKGDSKIN